jgi:ADP-ribose pyrophosphatase
MHPLEKFKFCPICGSKNFEENNAISKKCSDCGFTYYFNPRAATVALIRNEKGELLVARRAKEPAKGTLDLPGGFTDCYETAEQGVAREVIEETGLKLKSEKYLFSLPNIYPYSGINIHTMDLFFECETEGNSQLSAMDDVAELSWIALNDINADDFGLESIRKGIKIYKEMIINKKTF